MIVHVFYRDLLALFCRCACWDLKQFGVRLNKVSHKSVQDAMHPRLAQQRLCGRLTTMDLCFTCVQVGIPGFTHVVRAMCLGNGYRYR